MSILDDFPNAGYKTSTYGRSFNQKDSNKRSHSPPCPTCGSRKSIVVETRSEGEFVRRRRKCSERDSCQRWNTYESSINPKDFKAPDLTVLDKNRIIRSSEALQALVKSLNL